jgi:hypothetical protein
VTLDLDALERLAAEASPGPWRHWHGSTIDQIQSVHGSVVIGCGVRDCTRPRGVDTAFIAAAREAVPLLVARVRELAADKEAALNLVVVEALENADLSTEMTKLRADYAEVYDALLWWRSGGLMGKECNQ